MMMMMIRMTMMMMTMIKMMIKLVVNSCKRPQRHHQTQTIRFLHERQHFPLLNTTLLFQTLHFFSRHYISFPDTTFISFPFIGFLYITIVPLHCAILHLPQHYIRFLLTLSSKPVHSQHKKKFPPHTTFILLTNH